MLKKEDWIEMGTKLGEIVAKKNEAYGDAVRNVARIIKILYPNGISTEQIPAMLVIVRMIDKMSRIANQPNFGGEDPALDISGYGLLLQDLIVNGLDTVQRKLK